VSRLTPTAEMTLGPFFPREFAQGANDLTLVNNKRAEGEVIEITGTVTELDGKPLDNVVVEIWQADAKGRYDNANFFGWGRAATDANGRYSFRTVKPGSVGGRAPHINFLVLYSGLMRHLQTTMFFDKVSDPVLDVVKHRERLIAKKISSQSFVFDLRLRGEGETPFFDD
jgi:protocatechuate 3,4-dioxygenase, alpha subunit